MHLVWTLLREINNVRTRGILKTVRSHPGEPNQRKASSSNISQGHSGTKVQCESCLFSQGTTPEFTKMGQIHELFVLPLSLVWFAGATPETDGCWKSAGKYLPFHDFERVPCSNLLIQHAPRKAKPLRDFPTKMDSSESRLAITSSTLKSSDLIPHAIFLTVHAAINSYRISCPASSLDGRCLKKPQPGRNYTFRYSCFGQLFLTLLTAEFGPPPPKIS